MELTKKANGESYKFASEELVSSFIELCKQAGTEDQDIIEMLQSLETSKIDQLNRSYSEA